MYFVKYGDTYLHDPRIDGVELFELSLESEENSCGYCDFTMYNDHPMYGKIKERDSENPIQIYDNDELLFSGFIYELGKEFYLNGIVKCKGELDYLNDSIVRPYSTNERSFGDKAPENVDGYFNWLIEQHNNQVEYDKRFVVGINQGADLDKNNYIYRSNDTYPTVLDEIKEKLLDNKNAGGYLRIRHEDGVRYIDYISEFTDENAQMLDFGVNLTDYTHTDDSSEIASFIVPIGDKLPNTEYYYNDGYKKTTDTSPDSTKEYFTKSLNSYHQCGKMYRFEKEYTYYEYNASLVRYFRTSDTTVNHNKTYYTYSETDGKYHDCGELEAFQEGTVYYEYDDGMRQTTDTDVNSSKTYYRKIFQYTGCKDLSSFISWKTYYEYSEDRDESDQFMNIGVLPDGSTTNYNGYIISKDKIYSMDAVDKYGWIGMVYDNDDITIAENLVEKAVAELKKQENPKRSIEIKAVDMHLVNQNVKPIKIGEYVRVRSVPHNVDNYFLCRSIDLDLNNPENSLYTLGTTYDTLTGQQSEKLKELDASINKQYEAVGEVSKKTKKNTEDIDEVYVELQQARNNADDAICEVYENALDVQAETDDAICNLYESGLEYQAQTDDAICELYELIVGGE